MKDLFLISRPLLLIVLATIALRSNAQKLSEKFNGIVKSSPFLMHIAQDNDDNYLVWGDISYDKNAFVGSVVKVDQAGKLIESFPKISTDENVKKVVPLSSGKYLLTGDFRYVNGKASHSLAVVNNDGTVDESFAYSPSSTITWTGLQSDKILIVESNTNSNVYVLNRLLSDGTIDDTFTSYTTSNFIQDVHLTSSGEILIVSSMTMVKLGSNGVLDPSFSLSFTYDDEKYFGASTIQDDDKIVVAVSKIVSYSPFQTENTLVRYNVDGSKDDTFHASSADAGFTSVVARANGKIAATGYFTSFESAQTSAIELNEDGTFSKSLIVTDYNGMDNVYEDSQGNMFVTGGFKTAGGKNIENVVKLKPSNEIDDNFIVSLFSSVPSIHTVLGVQSSGKLIISGDFFISGIGSTNNKIGRLNLDGSVDASFATPISNQTSNGSAPTITAMAVQDDDKVVIAGFNLLPGYNGFIRLMPDGALDNSFAAGLGPFHSSFGGSSAVQAMKIRDSKIYIAGQFNRYDGAICQSFAVLDKNGKMIGPEIHSLPADTYIQDMEFQSDGRLILMGQFNLAGSARNFVRLNLDGTIDESFTLNVPGNCIDFDIDKEDEILVAGNYINHTDNILAKYGKDGGPSLGFDQKDGFTKSHTYFTAYIVEVLDDGSVVVGGLFSGYQGIGSQSLVHMTNHGEIIPFENDLDEGTIPLCAEHANRSVYLVGRFTKDNFQTISSTARIITPLGSSISAFDAESVSPTSIQLSWADKFEGADNITVEQSSPDEPSFKVVANLPPNLNAYTVTGLEEYTRYDFRIKGVNEYYTSPASFNANDTTGVMAVIAFEPAEWDKNSFNAEWQHLPNTDSCLLQVSSDNFVSFLQGYERLIVKSSTASVAGLQPFTTYSYRVKRFRGEKSSEFSNTVIVNLITEVESEESPLTDAFPNPFSEKLTVRVHAAAKSAQASIFSIDGRLMKSVDLTGRENVIATEQLPSGFFILTLTIDNKEERIKILKR